MKIPEHTWKKSSYSDNGGNCVEVALGEPVGVRDTKTRQSGQLIVTTAAWQAALNRLRQA